MIKTKEFNLEAERKLLTALIISDEFCRNLVPILNVSYLRGPYSVRVLRWILRYYKKYQKAPGKDIQDIYESERNKLKESEQELIEEFLSNLSRDYAKSNVFNVPYLMDQSLKYLRERAILVHSQAASGLVLDGKLEEAETVLLKFKAVARSTSDWIDPTEPKYVESVFRAKFENETENNTSFLFQMNGALGQFLGPFERGWFVCFMGPMKRGKTWMLQELAMQALFCRLNVVFISLEMDDKSIAARMYRGIAAFGDRAGEFLYPCFDCLQNQAGTCSRAQRTNSVNLLSPTGEKPVFEEAPVLYKPCTACRGKGLREYVPETWFVKIKRGKPSYHKVLKQLNGLSTMHGNRLRVKSYPSFSASVSDISRGIDTLEHLEDLVADVIVVDYADILAPENEGLEGRDRVDETWKFLKRLAGTKHCLVASATQSARRTLSRANVEDTDTSEDIRKLAHVDAMYTLNQTTEDKRKGIMRIGTVAHRHREFDKKRQVIILQNLGLGQAALDSEKI